MPLNPSAEMYLETIHLLHKKKASVRSIDIAEQMNFSKPSVSRAVANLKKDGYITVDSNGYISLTEKGLALSQTIYERHTVLTKIFTLLGVDEKIASEDACKIEHVISDETFQALKKHLEENK